MGPFSVDELAVTWDESGDVDLLLRWIGVIWVGTQPTCTWAVEGESGTNEFGEGNAITIGLWVHHTSIFPFPEVVYRSVRREDLERERLLVGALFVEDAMLASLRGGIRYDWVSDEWALYWHIELYGTDPLVLVERDRKDGWHVELVWLFGEVGEERLALKVGYSNMGLGDEFSVGTDWRF